MAEKIQESGSLDGYEFVSVKIEDKVLHRVTVTGPISLHQRIPLYNLLLKINLDDHFFCILDNSKGYENNLSYEDMEILDGILVNGGIKYFYGVTVTTDYHYKSIVKLAKVRMNMKGLRGDLSVTTKLLEAEKFIRAKMLAYKP